MSPDDWQAALRRAREAKVCVCCGRYLGDSRQGRPRVKCRARRCERFWNIEYGRARRHRVAK